MGQLEIDMQSAAGSYQLRRYPVYKNECLRAWDAADEYLLQHLVDNKLLHEKISLLIINDVFGGLSIPLHEFNPLVMTDSYLSSQGIMSNLQINDLPQEAITICSSLDSPGKFISGKVDVVLIKLPKSLAMLEDQLHRIHPLLDRSTVIIAAGMTKNIHSSTMKLFERVIGQTKSSLARKKARLIFSQYDEGQPTMPVTYPTRYKLPYMLDGVDIEVSNHAAVFSQDKLDIGARFFIENLPAEGDYKTIVDLGCGNGVLGLMAAIKNPAASIIFTDESYMAIESAIDNFVAVFGDERGAEFLQTDCLQGVADASVSLILCNPPFHQNNAITDNVAWQMFSESRAALETGGELWVIGNRHLAYHAKLKRLFDNCEVVASNKKFTLLKAVKR